MKFENKYNGMPRPAILVQCPRFSRPPMFTSDLDAVEALRQRQGWLLLNAEVAQQRRQRWATHTFMARPLDQEHHRVVNFPSMHAASARRRGCCCSSEEEKSPTSSFTMAADGVVDVDGPGKRGQRRNGTNDPRDPPTSAENHLKPLSDLPITSEWSAVERRG